MRPTPTASRLKSLFANVRIFLYTVLQNRSDTDLAKTNKIMIIIHVISQTMNILPFQSSLYPLGRTKLDSINEFHTIRSKKRPSSVYSPPSFTIVELGKIDFLFYTVDAFVVVINVVSTELTISFFQRNPSAIGIYNQTPLFCICNKGTAL